ncbi:MAG: carbohydrate kinase family protein [Patescibacteria group bacterium]
MFDLLAIGDATLDTFLVIDEATLNCDLQAHHCQLCFNYADKIPIRDSAQSVGGNAANVAVGARRLGLQTALISDLGDDQNGRLIKEQMEKEKVDTGNVRLLPKKATRYAVVLNYKSERTILSYYSDRQYRLPPLPPTKWIFYTSLGKTFENLQIGLIKHLTKNKEIKLAVNPGSYEIKKGAVEFKKILPYTEILFVNKEEAEALAGHAKSTLDTIKKLHQLGAKKVVLTDGHSGSFASDGRNCHSMGIYPVAAVGKTGAGDAYTGGFLSAVICGENLEAAMRWGTANATGVIQKLGAQKGLLTRSGIASLIKKYPKINPVIVA